MIIPEIKISVKILNNVRINDLPKVSSSQDVSKVLRKCFDEDTFLIQEQFIILMMNNANRVIGHYKLSNGGLSKTVVDLRLIFSTAIKSFASAIIIAHNHPSGNLTPSNADKAVTRKIKEAGILLDIRLLDHLILTQESYLSFADEGIL